MKPIRTDEIDGKEVEVYYEGPTITKKEAEEKGLSRYFDPKIVCVRGHISERYVGNSACIACSTNRGNIVLRKKFVKDEKNAVNYTRAAMAAYGYKPWTTQKIKKDLEKMKANAQSDGALAQFILFAHKKGQIEKLGNRGQYMQYRLHPKFFCDTHDMVDLLCKLNPEHSGSIKEAYKKGMEDYGKTAQMLEHERAEDQALKELEDFRLEETPIALMGRAIVEYINKLRSHHDYDIAQEKISEMKRTIANFRGKNDMLAARVTDYVEKNNRLELENHNLKMENQKLKNQLDVLSQLVKSRSTGNFTVGEVARIKSLLGDDFLSGLPTEIRGRLQ